MGTGEIVIEKKVRRVTGELKSPCAPKDNKVVLQCGDPDDRWPWAVPAPDRDRHTRGQTYGFIA